MLEKEELSFKVLERKKFSYCNQSGIEVEVPEQAKPEV